MHCMRQSHLDFNCLICHCQYVVRSLKEAAAACSDVMANARYMVASRLAVDHQGGIALRQPAHSVLAARDSHMADARAQSAKEFRRETTLAT